MSTTSRGPSRRTLVKGAAWSVPVVAVAGAAPAMAASPVVVVAATTACKHPGNPSRYHFDLLFTNTSNTPTAFRIRSITMTPNSGTPVTFTEHVPPPDQSFTVAGNGSALLVIDSNETPNSANGTLLVTYEYLDSNGNWVEFATPLTSASMPPCQQQGIPDHPHCDYQPGRAFPPPCTDTASQDAGLQNDVEGAVVDAEETAVENSTEPVAPATETAPAAPANEAPAAGEGTTEVTEGATEAVPPAADENNG